MNRQAKKTLNFLVYKCQYSEKVGRRIMWAYGLTIGIEKGKTEQDYIELGKAIQDNWDGFMKWFGSIPKDTYPKHTANPKKRSDSFYDDISEALQYSNGCTDNF